MYTSIMTSRELLDLVSGQPRDYERGISDIEPSAKAGQQMTTFWSGTEPFPKGKLPGLITIPSEEQRDFLAWAYTYLSALRPFTAFIRLLDPTTASKLLERNSKPDIGRYGEAFVALIICDSMTHLAPRSEMPQQLTPNACANSHSYALARAVALGSEDLTGDVSSAWASVRGLTRQRQWEHNLEELRTAFRVLLGCRTQQSALVATDPPALHLFEKACREICEAGDIRDETWSELTGHRASLSALRGQMADSRESRVRTFDNAWVTIAGLSQANPTLASFLSGYLGSRIAPGELDHAGIVARTLEAAPGALLWFGVCSGIRSDGQVLAFSKGLGQRILRDLEQDSHVLDNPRCDLAIAELQVLFDREMPLGEFRTGGAGSLTVELMPGVTTSVRWPAEQNGQGDLFDRRDVLFETRDLVREMSMALDRVDYLRARLERAVNLSGGAPSRNRTEPKRKKGY